MNILVVDDSATMRMIVIKSLRQAGFESATVIEASGAKEALQKLAAGGIDLVLSDVNMPEITGIEMVKVVKAKMPKLPIVMVTTESSPELKQQMLAAGANGIITKPFPPEELKKVLTPLLKA
ncbi:MAG: response regulator [Bdellovibrionota bacterium]